MRPFVWCAFRLDRIISSGDRQGGNICPPVNGVAPDTPVNAGLMFDGKVALDSSKVRPICDVGIVIAVRNYAGVKLYRIEL